MNASLSNGRLGERAHFPLAGASLLLSICICTVDSCAVRMENTGRHSPLARQEIKNARVLWLLRGF